MERLRAARLSEHVVVTGGYDGGNRRDEVLQYEETTGTWSEIGRMKKARSHHAVVAVDDVCYADCKVEDWSIWSKCSATCGDGTKTRGRAVIREAENGGAPCPALEEEEPCNTDQCPVDCEVEDWSSWTKCSATCGGGNKTRGRGVVQEAEIGGAICPALEEEESCNTDQCKAYSEPDERIYWVLVSIPILFFLIGVLILCWNQCGLLKPYYFFCCALCKKMEKEDLNTNYGTDLDDASYVMEVRDANPEYDSVEASQGTKVRDKNSPKNQAIDQNSDYEPSSIYDSMENDQKDTRQVTAHSADYDSMEN